MKKLLLTAAALVVSASGALAQDVVRLGSEGAYPPYNFINDATGEVDGFERALGDELCERAGLTCEWVTNAWATIIPNLVAGNYDAIMAGMSITEPRMEVISFTQEYMPPDPSAFIALAGTDPSVRESGVIAAQSTTIQASYVAESDAELVEYASPDETIAALLNDEVDAVLADRGFLVPYVEASGGDIEFLGEPLEIGGGIGMGIRQSDDELRDAFNEQITAMKDDGTLNALIIEWFGEDQTLFE